MDYLLGIDIGTSSVKVLVLGNQGEIIGTSSQEYGLLSPKPGWAEQNPEDLWLGTIQAIKQALSQYGISGGQIGGIGLSGQMHSAIFLDSDKRVLRPAILWNDTRTTAQCRQIEKLVGLSNLRLVACNPCLEGFTAPKVLWLKENEPENYNKLRHLLLPKDYIRYRLTGSLKMELSDAAGTLLLDVRKGKWSTEILAKLGIAAEILPEIIGSSEIAGVLTTEAAELSGLKPGIPIVGGGADNACGAVGAGAIEEGRALISLGTSGVMLSHLKNPLILEQGTIHMLNSAVPDEFYMMGVMLSSGQSFNWFQKQIASGFSYAEMEEKISLQPAGSNSLLFLPYLSGERTPHGDSSARGVFTGLSHHHNRWDMGRAVLEGVAFSFNDSLRLMRQAGWRGNTVRGIGGGMSSKLWRQIIASVTGLRVESLNINEGPALGAAILAGVGIGLFSSLSEITDEIVTIVGVTEPVPEWTGIYRELYQHYQSVYAALAPTFKAMAKPAMTSAVKRLSREQVNR